MEATALPHSLTLYANIGVMKEGEEVTTTAKAVPVALQRMPTAGSGPRSWTYDRVPSIEETPVMRGNHTGEALAANATEARGGKGVTDDLFSFG